MRAVLKKFIVPVVLSLCLGMAAWADDPSVSAGAVEVGEWNGNFDACKAFAETNKIPMVMFWGWTDCTFCDKMIAAFKTEDFIAWQVSKKFVFCYVHAAAKDVTPALTFARNSRGYTPFISVYWPVGGVYTNFPGRWNYMPVTVAGSAPSDAATLSKGLAEQLTASVDSLLAGYVPASDYAGGTFLVPGTVSSRLEAEVGKTTFVEIPLVRTNNTYLVATNSLVIGDWTNTFEWAAYETKKFIRFELPAGLAAGTVLTNYLYDAGDMAVGALGGTNTITVVAEMANTTHNPLWLRERTADTLAAGEWTMDLDVATNRTARQAGEAYTAVYFAGLYWCPWCEAFDKTVVQTSEFSDWSSRHNIALVVLENPFRSGVGPTILRYETWTKNIYGYGKSGAGYLSRKMVDMADVPAMEARSYDLGYNVWNLPENTRGFVTYPALLLLRKDGSVAGRWIGQDLGDQHYHFLKSPMLKRLEEMISLADDPTEERNRDWALTETGLGVTDSADGTLQVVDALDVFKLTNLVQSTRLMVNLKGPEAGSVRLSMLQLTTAGTTNTLATAEGNLSGDGVTIFGRAPVEGTCFISVTTMTNDGAFWPQSESSTVRSYTLKTSVAAPLPDGEVKQGQWTSDLAAAKAYAEKYALPMVSVSVNDCDSCGFLEGAFVQSDFTDWAASRKPLLVLQRDADNAACPYVSVYWPKEDGTTVTTNFTGRAGQMLVTEPVAPAYDANAPIPYIKALAQQFIASVDAAIPGWSPVPVYAGGTFLVPGTQKARLEAEAGYTTRVEIPFVRSVAKSLYAATNTLVIGEWTNTFEWAVGETNKYVDFPIPVGAVAGDVLTNFLSDAGTVFTNTITMVAVQPVSSENPLWIGERTADTLQSGEWTMDLDVATNRTARQAGDAYTFVVVGGELWCPDCIGARTNLLGTAEFAQWVATNNVSLVLVDIPNNGRVPSFLTHDVYKNGVSGSAYLSRKMIPNADANAIFERNHGLCYETWNLPYEGRKRLWLPSFVLLRKDGTFAGKKSDYDRGDYKYPLAPQIQRFYEMIELAKDPTEGFNCDPATTALSLGLTDSGTNSLQSVDKVDVWSLSNTSAGLSIHAALSGDSAAAVKLTLKQIGEGATTTVATVTGDLKTGISLDGVLAGSAPAYLFVEGTDAEVFSKVCSGSTVRGYTLATSFVLAPQDTEGSYVYSDGGTVPVALKAGTVYLLTGFGDLSSVAGLTAANAVLGLYTATESATVALPLGEGAGTAKFRQWNPGTVGFTVGAQRLIEASGTGYVVVSRTGGGSGAVTATVSLDTAASTAVNGARFTWTDATLTWADGETGPKTNTFAVLENKDYEGEQQFVLDLALDVSSVTAGTTAGISNHTVTLFDSSQPVLNQESYVFTLYTDIPFTRAEPIHNILEDNRQVSLNKLSGSLPRGIKVSYDNGSQTFVLSGMPTAIGDSTAVYAVTESRSGGVVATSPAITFMFHVVDSSTKNAMCGQAFSYSGCPVYATKDGESFLAGTLSLAVSRTGRMSLKYSGTRRTASFTVYGWSGIDSDTGLLTAQFPKRYGCTIAMAMATNGVATALIHDPSNTLSDVSTELSADFSAMSDATSYAGYYTVTLPYASGDGLSATNADGQAFAASGTAFLTLKMDTSCSIRKCRMTYAGFLPDGTSVSGSTWLCPNGNGTSTLPIFVRRSSRELLGAALNIKANAAATYQEDPQIILRQSGTVPYWQHTETDYSFRTVCEIYGGYYYRDILLDACCADTYETTEMHFHVANEVAASASLRYGEITSVPETIVSVTSDKLIPSDAPNGLRLKLSHKTGLFTGRFKIGFANGKAVYATYRGVLLPGWTDCGCTDKVIIERPFGSGSCWFTDYLNNRPIRRGVTIDFVPLAK